MSPRLLLSIGFAATLGVWFTFALQLPVRPAEATTALAALETAHMGDAVASHQLGELEPARLPLHPWILSALARERADRVSVTAARGVSFLAIVAAALAGAAVFGAKRGLAAALILSTPAIWAVAIRGTPGALLAMLLTFAWAAYEAGRRLGAPTLQWALPPVLGAAASLVWSPAMLFVALGLLLEAARLATRRGVAWARWIAGSLGAAALIGLWQMAYAGFVADAPTWWSRMTADLLAGDPVLASRGLASRASSVLGVWVPAAVLAALGRGRLAPADVRPAFGTACALLAVTAAALLAPGIPPAAAVPAGIAALGFFARSRVEAGNTGSAGPVVVAALLALVAMQLAQGRRDAVEVDAVPLAAIGSDVPVVVDRELDARETWAVVSRLGRPARRAARLGEPAFHVGPSPAGTGISVAGPLAPEAWSLLGRPLERPAPGAEARMESERKLEEARARHDEQPQDALRAIWVGRRLAYLGRYQEALAWYGDLTLVHPGDARVWRHRGHRYISVRELQRAIHDLSRAADLEQGKPDRVEPDGLPNAAGIPRSTTQTNIWYHLGLAHYLSGDLPQAARCFRRCVELSDNDDMWVAAAHWLHIALRRTGRAAEAAALLHGVRDEMEILENDAYHDLLLLYAGRLSAEGLQDRLDRGDEPGGAALAYGLARWYEDRGDAARAHAAYRAIVAESPWAAFGAIAAEVELATRLKRETPVW